jgi:hypothetical protein
MEGASHARVVLTYIYISVPLTSLPHPPLQPSSTSPAHTGSVRNVSVNGTVYPDVVLERRTGVISAASGATLDRYIGRSAPHPTLHLKRQPIYPPNLTQSIIAGGETKNSYAVLKTSCFLPAFHYRGNRPRRGHTFFAFQVFAPKPPAWDWYYVIIYIYTYIRPLTLIIIYIYM